METFPSYNWYNLSIIKIIAEVCSFFFYVYHGLIHQQIVWCWVHLMFPLSYQSILQNNNINPCLAVMFSLVQNITCNFYHSRL